MLLHCRNHGGACHRRAVKRARLGSKAGAAGRLGRPPGGAGSAARASARAPSSLAPSPSARRVPPASMLPFFAASLMAASSSSSSSTWRHDDRSHRGRRSEHAFVLLPMQPRQHCRLQRRRTGQHGVGRARDKAAAAAPWLRVARSRAPRPTRGAGSPRRDALSARRGRARSRRAHPRQVCLHVCHQVVQHADVGRVKHAGGGGGVCVCGGGGGLGAMGGGGTDVWVTLQSLLRLRGGQ